MWTEEEMGPYFDGATHGDPTPGTGFVVITQMLDVPNGWEASWQQPSEAEDGPFHALTSPYLTLEEALQWAASKPTPKRFININRGTYEVTADGEIGDLLPSEPQG